MNEQELMPQSISMNRTGVSSKILQVRRASPASGGTIMSGKMPDIHNIRIFLAGLDFDKLSRAKAPPIHSFLTAAIVGVELSVHPYSFDRLPSINSGQAGQVGSDPLRLRSGHGFETPRWASGLLRMSAPTLYGSL